jgi:hypothetical protein
MRIRRVFTLVDLEYRSSRLLKRGRDRYLIVSMSLQLPPAQDALPGTGRDPNLTFLVEPVIYCWVQRKVANSGFALAHDPGSELNVRVPARPYRQM